MLKISNCVNDKLALIYKQALQINTLQKTILALLPTPFLSHIRVGSFNKGCLMLYCDDSVWATQIRFMLPELRDQLRCKKDFHNLCSIKLLINTEIFTTKEDRKGDKPLSKATRHLLHESAEQCTYEPLRKALENLARTK